MTDEEKINILVVDDVPDKLMAMEAILEELGQNVVSVGSGREALRQLLDRDFAVILLDINMPGMDGFETAALIRQRQRSEHTPIIFITAFSEETHVAQGYSLGAVDYILAPVVPEVLRAKVSVFVDLYRKTQQVKRQADQRVALAREQAGRAAAEHGRRRSEFLAEASKVLAKSLNVKATLEGLLRLVVPAVADVAGITLFKDAADSGTTEWAWIQPKTRSWRRVATEPDALNRRLLQAIHAVSQSGAATDFAGDAAAEGDEFCLDGESASPQIPAVASTMLIPLIARSRTLGVLCLGFSRLRSQSQSADQPLFEDLGNRAAMALDNARLYGEVQEGDRRKDEFLAMLGHELRNPLAAISNALDCLRVARHDEAIVTDAEDVLERQVAQMGRLVDDLLDVSRITRGKIELRKELIELKPAILRAVAAADPAITARRHQLHVSLPEKPIALHADPVRLEQIFSNLLNNAAKYTEPGGQIWLSANCEGDHVVLRVRDTGIGITSHLLPTIFDLFSQGDRSLDRSQGGLGIGLTLVRSLVQMHGGQVEAVSKGAMQGSQFIVRLPRFTDESKSLVSEQPASENCRVNASSRRVLLVDDNSDLVHTMATLLKTLGHDVRVALDGSSAIDCLAEFQPDLALIDIGLPGMNGYEIAKFLSQRLLSENTRLVAMTGYGQSQDRERAIEAGFHEHLVKPVPLSALQELLARLESPAVEKTVCSREL